jgi:hypothetical protein
MIDEKAQTFCGFSAHQLKKKSMEKMHVHLWCSSMFHPETLNYISIFHVVNDIYIYTLWLFNIAMENGP